MFKYSFRFFVLLFISLVSNAENTSGDITDSSKNDKTVSKRGIHSYLGPRYTDYSIPTAVPFYGEHYHQRPLFAPHQSFKIVPGEAAVTSYSSNFPQYHYLPKPFHHQIPFVVSKPAFIPAPAPVPSFNHFYPSPYPNVVPNLVPNYVPNHAFIHQKPIIPIAIPVPGQFILHIFMIKVENLLKLFLLFSRFVKTENSKICANKFTRCI